jgi:hypothetical protein
VIPTTYINGNTGIPTWEEFTQYVSFTFTYRTNIAGGRELNVKNVVPINDYTQHLTTTAYIGEKIRLSDNTYTYEQFSPNLQNVSPRKSRQGGAVFGDYLFQFHDTLAKVCVYNLATKTNVQILTNTAIAKCHANGGGFSNIYYNSNDPFPLLYIDSMYESRVYVFRLTGSIGNLSMTLVQTIFLDFEYFYTDIAIDTANNQLVIYCQDKPNGLYPDGSKTIIMHCDIPSISGSSIILSDFRDKFSIPCIFAMQGAFAWRGKIYISYGNAGSTHDNGGIIVCDYINKCVTNIIGVDAIGDIEPEALCLWRGKMILTTQDGEIYCLDFD